MPRRNRVGSPEAAVRAALAEGRVFAAYNLARTGLEAARDGEMLHLLAATALVRSGALEAARCAIAQTAVGSVPPQQLDAGSDHALLLAEVLEELWQAGGVEAERRRALTIRLERARAPGGSTDQARAAMLAHAGGDQELARELARSALGRARTAAGTNAGQLLELAELCLLVGDPARAGHYLRRLAEQQQSPIAGALVRRQLLRLTDRKIAIDPALVALFDPAILMVFAGIAPDQMPGGEVSPALEAAIGKAIADQLGQLAPAIAYGSAAAGCDLLFAEALLARGTELNIILPFQRDSFRDRLVAPHGDVWRDRFDRVLAAAASVTDVSGEQYYDPAILRFGNQVIDGTARLRGAALSSTPYLVAVWDYLAPAGPGGPSDFIDHWGDPSRLRLIGLDELAAVGAAGATAAASPARARADGADGQRVASMMFADVVGFSRIKDTQLAAFWQFMRAVAFHMGAGAPRPELIDSWGDAILAVHRGPLAAADYATALASAFATIDSRHFGLPERLQLRVGLHAGPVFEGLHPITHQRIVYGSNVNRTARIEPITVPGRVYASDQFVAVLTAEESAMEAETRLHGGTYRPRYRCSYRGILELAKGYGIQAVYEVEPWRSLAGGRVVLEPGVRLQVTLANDLEEHRRLSALFLQLVEPLAPADDVVHACETAIDEIVTNICHYAWNDEAQHTIDVEILVRDGRIEATFTDDGVAFDPLAAVPQGLDSELDEREAGGLGIHLVKALMDEVRYRRDGGLNRLTLVKRLRTPVCQADRSGSRDDER